MIRQRVIVFFLLIIGVSFISQYNTAHAVTKKQISAIKKSVVSAYKSFEKEIDVSGYNLNHTGDKNITTQIMTEVLTQTPGLFYSGLTYQKVINPDTGHVKRIILSYDKAYMSGDGSVNTKKIKSAQKKIDKEIKTALKLINSKMTKIEKALVLHDYLIQNTAYYNGASLSSRTTEAGVFLDKKANCQGYSIAYAMLMQRIGVSVKYISSESMAHIWNMIKIGGKWYHVDVTWDDPVEMHGKTDQYGLVRHDYFLCSTKRMKKEGYRGFSAPSASSTKYDSSWWKSISTAIHYRNGKWIYINQNGIASRNKLLSGSAKILRALSGKAMIKFNSNLYYLITQNSVYLYNYTTNSLKRVWSPKNRYGSSYYLTQIKYKNGRVYYRVLSGIKYKNGSFKVKKTNGLAA